MDPQPPVNNQPYPTPDNTTGQQPGQFTPNEPPKSNKTGLIVAVVVVVVLILGVAAYVMMKGDKKDNSKSTSTNNSTSTANEGNAASGDLQKYDVNDKNANVNFSVSFYKGATIIEKKGRIFLNVGEEGSMRSVYLTPSKGEKIDCGTAPSTSMSLGGKSTTVCYNDDYKQYAGYIDVKGTPVQVNVAGQKAIDMAEAKTILESVKIN
jgi:hypothetical protein